MLKSDLNKIVEQYRSTKDIKVIEDGLGYSTGSLNNLEEELYVFYVDNSRFEFEMPRGDEKGANAFWTPGGRTFGGFKEAVITDKLNPLSPITHDKNLGKLQSQFRFEKIKNF
jgi:hypothetical protein